LAPSQHAPAFGFHLSVRSPFGLRSSARFGL
jgi:hypothetical protein